MAEWRIRKCAGMTDWKAKYGYCVERTDGGGSVYFFVDRDSPASSRYGTWNRLKNKSVPDELGWSRQEAAAIAKALNSLKGKKR